MRISACILLGLVLVGCGSNSTPYQTALTANHGTATSLSSTGAVLGEVRAPLKSLGEFVVDRGRGYYDVVVSMIDRAAALNGVAEQANAKQKAAIDGLEKARSDQEVKYLALEAKWYTKVGRWIDRLFFWLKIIAGLAFVAAIVGKIVFDRSAGWLAGVAGFVWKSCVYVLTAGCGVVFDVVHYMVDWVVDRKWPKKGKNSNGVVKANNVGAS